VDVERQHLPPVHLRRRRRRRDLGGGGGGAPRTEAGSGEVAADEIREVGSRSRRGCGGRVFIRRDSLPLQLVRSRRGTSAASPPSQSRLHSSFRG
jgi:hypothetical protein